MKVLVTGGAGYIGSHIVVELLQQNHDVIIVDNFYNSKIETTFAIEKIAGKTVHTYIMDIRDEEALNLIFETEKPDMVIHLAGLKAVGESMVNPFMYWQWNVKCTYSLLKAMMKNKCKNIVFSSTATVYDVPSDKGITEAHPIKPTNTYASTKLVQENMIIDMARNHGFNAMILRYFNPIGAHPSGLIGEDPKGIPNNLIPFIQKVVIGEQEKLRIFGIDYPTRDGTCIRDYIHVVDLAKAHIKAMDHFDKFKGYKIYNLGTGEGHSVVEIVDMYQGINNVEIPHQFCGRRPGDASQFWCNPTRANIELGWEAELTLEDMCRDSYNFIMKQKEMEENGNDTKM